MADPKFTKGPWKVCIGNKSSDGICSCHQISSTDYPVAKVEHGEWGDSYPSLRFVAGTTSLDSKVEAYIERIPYGEIPESESTANAHLIAAAPDGYALAKEIIEHLYDEQDMERVRDMAKSFIAKAQGNQQ